MFCEELGQGFPSPPPPWQTWRLNLAPATPLSPHHPLLSQLYNLFPPTPPPPPLPLHHTSPPPFIFLLLLILILVILVSDFLQLNMSPLQFIIIILSWTIRGLKSAQL